MVFRAPVSRLEDLHQTFKWFSSKLIGQVYNLFGSREYPNVGWYSSFNKTASLFSSESS